MPDTPSPDHMPLWLDRREPGPGLVDQLAGMAYQCRNDAHWTMEFVSDGALELTGYRPAELIENTRIAYVDMIHPEDRGLVRRSVDEGLAADGRFEVEYRIRTAEGETRWVRERGHGVYDTEGRLLGLEGFIMDIDAWRRAEVRLREREQLLTAIVDHLPGGIVHVFDRELRYVFSAGQGLDRVGLSDATLKGRTVREVLGPGLGNEVADHYGRVIDGETVRFEGDFGGRSFLVTAAPLEDEAGSVTGVLTLSLDVTERKEAAEALRRTRDELEAVYRAAPVPIFVMDPDGVVTRWNVASESTFGWTAEEAVGQMLPIVQADRLEEFAGLRARVMEGETLAGIDALRRRKDGTELPVRIYAAPLREADGGITGLVGMAVDVSAEKEREAALVSSNRALSLLSASNQAVLRSTAEEEILDEVCRAAVEEGGYRLAWVELVDPTGGSDLVAWRTGAEGLTAPRAGEPSSPARKAVQSGEPVVLQDLGEHNPVWLDARAREEIGGCAALPLIIEDQRLGALVVCSATAGPFDRNELRILEEMAGDLAYGMGVHRARQREARLSERLRRAEKLEAIGHLAGGVAHDFNNSLTVILGLTELILDDQDLGDRVRSDVRELRAAAEASANLTRQLLAFSHQQVVHRQHVFLDEVVEDKLAFLERLLGERYAVELALEPGTGPVLIDPTQIEQIVMNLSVNARDAMPDGGRLKIETRHVVVEGEAPPELAVGDLEPGRYATLALADTGAGMAPETVDRVFDPFFTTKARGKGTGLGLATVYGIVEQADGAIAIETRPGHGTRFCIYFPMAETEEEVPGPKKESPPPKGEETILVVEDEAPVRQVIARVLKGQGYRVLEADSVERAEALFREAADAVDLLLTDIVLPDGSGRDLAARLTRQRPKLPTVLCSGYDPDDVDAEPDREMFLPKPFDRDTLARTVREALDA